jgi:hypothetical protein
MSGNRCQRITSKPASVREKEGSNFGPLRTGKCRIAPNRSSNPCGTSCLRRRLIQVLFALLCTQAGPFPQSFRGSLWEPWEITLDPGRPGADFQFS